MIDAMHALGYLKVDLPRILASSDNAAIVYFARRELLGWPSEDASRLWDLPQARRIVARQRENGAWRYPGGSRRLRSQDDYDQIETFRQLAILVEKYAFSREHPSIDKGARFLFSCQTDEGDFRGIYGNQYATTYVGAIIEILVKAGYGRDPRIARGFRWLLSMRQRDGGWAIPLRTVGVPFSEFLDAARHPAPIRPDVSKPSSHLVTGMVLRAFAAHDARRRASAAKGAGDLLASRLYSKDAYGDRGAVRYWERVSFPFWFTDVISALDSLSRLGFRDDDPRIRAALDRLSGLQRPDGTFALKLVRGADKDLPWWIGLAVCRVLERFGRSA